MGGTLGLVILITACLITMVTGRTQNVVVVGGGVAGLAAARLLSNDKLNRFHVQIYEAKRDRYGGRVWTKRNLSVNSKDIQTDLGGMLLNSKVPQNPLIDLTRLYEIETSPLGSMQFMSSDSGTVEKGEDLAQAVVRAKEIILKAVQKVRSDGGDMSLAKAVDREIAAEGFDDGNLAVKVIKSLPAYNIPDYSAALYTPEQLDFGFDTIVKFGLAEIVDRLVGGVEAEAPLDVNLRRVVRQIRVDHNRTQVLVRSRDGSQVSVDAVIVAVPLSALQNDSLLFEPSLPKDVYKTFSQLKFKQSERFVIEFDEMFWPKDVGTFILTPEMPEDAGMLLSWTNFYKSSGQSYIAGSISHGAVDKFHAMSGDELLELSLKRLSKLFGEDVVRSRNVTNILRSNWLNSLHIGGASVYPAVGNTKNLWDVFSKPFCPGIYLAGDYTMFNGLGSLHGAYNSGVRAAEALMFGYCDKIAAEEEAKRKQEEELRAQEENKTKEERHGQNKGEKTKKIGKNQENGKESKDEL